MQIQYVDELPDAQREAAAELFLTALGDKLTPLLGGGQRARRTLLESMNPRRCLAAIAEGQLVGLLAIHTSRGGFIDPSFRQLRDVYGFLSALWRIAGLAALSHHTSEKEWHVEGIAVEPTVRGRGVGSQLLDRFEEFARLAGAQRLTLQVIDTNHRALRLYEKLGFHITRVQTAWPLNRILGFPFNKVISMQKATEEQSVEVSPDQVSIN